MDLWNILAGRIFPLAKSSTLNAVTVPVASMAAVISVFADAAAQMGNLDRRGIRLYMGGWRKRTVYENPARFEERFILLTVIFPGVYAGQRDKRQFPERQRNKMADLANRANR